MDCPPLCERHQTHAAVTRIAMASDDAFILKVAEHRRHAGRMELVLLANCPAVAASPCPSP
jgi:hypothetical protein